MSVPKFTESQRLEAFLNKVSPEPNSGCWLWTGACRSMEYGSFNGTLAHRYSYQTFVGPIPNGLQIDHLCRVHCCVNPAHLEAVTASENSLRGIAGVHLRAASIEHNKYRRTLKNCKRGHELVPLVGHPYWRYCKVCAKAKSAQRWNGGRCAKGEQHPGAKLNAELVLEIRKRRAEGESFGALSMRFGIAAAHVFRVVNRTAWRHVQ